MISAQIVFVLWTYREKNEQDKIENQRFDTNIKYFEQIQERLKDIVPLNDEKESSPEIHLKVAAILQLADFIQGRYGENLRRPAFQLLLSVWETYVRPSYEKQTKEYHDDHDKNVSYRSVLVNDRLMQTLNLALMKGLTDKNLAASEPKTATFKGFEYDLSGLFLVGLHTTFTPDTQLIFKDIKLFNPNFDFSLLKNVQFTGVHLSSINFSRVWFDETCFKNCHLESISFCKCLYSNTNFKNNVMYGISLEIDDKTIQESIRFKAVLHNIRYLQTNQGKQLFFINNLLIINEKNNLHREQNRNLFDLLKQNTEDKNYLLLNLNNKCSSYFEKIDTLIIYKINSFDDIYENMKYIDSYNIGYSIKKLTKQGIIQKIP